MVRRGNSRNHLLNLVLAKANPALNVVFNVALALAKQLKPRSVKASTTVRKALKPTGETIPHCDIQTQELTGENYSTPSAPNRAGAPGVA